MIAHNARNPRGRQRAAVSALALALAMGSFASTAMAQDAEDEGSDKSDIVVTGTLIRGVAPGGTNVVSVGQADVQATGAATTAQLLQSIPQLGSFGLLQAPGLGQTVNRPNFRSLPGFNTGGGSTTLVLLDGHRIVGMGVSSTTPDPDFIPPGALQRVDVVPDGGSAIYGSDAVAGVMNFVTRRDFDGVEANARYGFGDDYHTFDANATIGRKWDGGSIFVSYAYAEHDALFGRDRDFVRQWPTSNSSVKINGQNFVGLPLTCSPGNIILSQTVYALPSRTANVANQCDLSDGASIFPKDHRHSVMAGLNQDLSDSLSVDVRAYYFNRESTTYSGPFTATKAAGIAGVSGRVANTRGFLANRINVENEHSVAFAYGGSQASRTEVGLSTWGVTTEFTYRPGADWRVRLMGNYGESTTTSFSPTVNDTALNRAISNGLFNPYDWTASDPAALGVLFNYGQQSQARQRLINLRLVADGTLFTLPGGPVKLAFGGEYIKEGYRTANGTGIPGQINGGAGPVSVGNVVLLDAMAAATRFNLQRDIKAVFGELSVPFFGPDNATTLFQALTLSLSGRYDYYSGGVGGTFNPKVGVNWTPFEGIRLRGAWGKAFNAPSLADAKEATFTSVGIIGQLGSVPFPFYRPLPALITAGTIPNYDPKQTILTINGNSPGIQPQTATTLSLGADIEPSFIPGLRLGVTYWRIRMKGAIGSAPFFDQNLWWNYYRHKITFNPRNIAGSTPAQIAAFDALVELTRLSSETPPITNICPDPAPLGTGPLDPACIYAISDFRKLNKGRVNVSGIDFNVSYRQETSFGGIDAAWRGSFETLREESAAEGSPLVDQTLANNNTFRFSTVVGADIGNLRAQVTWNFRKGYAITPTAAIPGTTDTQVRVGDYHVFNLFFKYDVKGEDMFKDLSFTLNVDNLFDKDPPVFYGSATTPAQSGYANGSTLGRIVTVGVSKRF